MQLKEAFFNREAEFDAGPGMVRNTYLALRRGGIDTLEQLRDRWAAGPEELERLRDIGPKRRKLIGTILQIYAPAEVES